MESSSQQNDGVSQEHASSPPPAASSSSSPSLPASPIATKAIQRVPTTDDSTNNTISTTKSTSTINNDTGGRHHYRPPWIYAYLPPCFRFDTSLHPIEATGLSVDVFARATIVMSSLFLGPALLELAKKEVLDEQCSNIHFNNSTIITNDEEDAMIEACLETAKVHGWFKPSSLLSNIAVVGGMLGAFFLPLFGSIVDQTPYRKEVGVYSAILLTIISVVELVFFASAEDSWFVICWLQIVTAVLFCIHVSSIYAYTSELSNEAAEQTKYNTHFFVILYGSTLLFMGETLGVSHLISWLFDDVVGAVDSVTIARIALGVSAGTCLICFTIAWSSLFRPRPALTVVNDNDGRRTGRCALVSSGFRSLGTVCLRIHREIPALRWLLLASLFGESANAAVVSIGTTFMVHYLKMDGSAVGLVFLVILLMGPIGTKVGEWLSLRWNPVTSAKLCLVTFMVNTGMAALVLTGPERSQYTMCFGILWGVCLGWLHPCFTAAFISLRPAGMDAQMMGVYLFCGTGFNWLPPLVFTILNEIGFHIAWCLASLNVFFGLGFLHLMALGNYDKAVTKASSQRVNGHDHPASPPTPRRLGRDDPTNEESMMELPELS